MPAGARTRTTESKNREAWKERTSPVGASVVSWGLLSARGRDNTETWSRSTFGSEVHWEGVGGIKIRVIVRVLSGSG